ncbi:ADORA2B [Branchiostoma lanceolatum]|uniref:ADORA2B protein n=1 Tax=Branchiostoma lanceolatum TaxID=7740 RepID=A0A8K0F041_BRALA|nr:ADORA2B [Branchiostoma lanceolatum]
MNGSMANIAGSQNSMMHETFWPCAHWHLENGIDYDLAVSVCSYLPTPFLEENRKVGIAAAVVGTISLLMNVAVLSCILRNRHLTRTMYLFVANLAAVDCVAGLFSFFICGVLQRELPPYLTLVGIFCLFFFVLVLSAVAVVLLSVDRYLAILHPIFYQTRMSGRHVAVSLGIAWPACAVVCLSPLMGWNCFSMKSENCTKYLPVGYLILLNIILFMVVLLVVFVNARILIVMKRQFSRTGPMENPRDDLPTARRREQRVAVRQHRQLTSSWKRSLTVVMITVVFIIIWLPICIGTVQQISCIAREGCEIEARPYWGLLVALCGSVTNPIIYAFRLKKIRETVQRRVRRLANAVRERSGRSSDHVVNINTIGSVRAMDAAGPSTDGRSPGRAVRQTGVDSYRNAHNLNSLDVFFVASTKSVKLPAV